MSKNKKWPKEELLHNTKEETPITIGTPQRLTMVKCQLPLKTPTPPPATPSASSKRTPAKRQKETEERAIRGLHPRTTKQGKTSKNK